MGDAMHSTAELKRQYEAAKSRTEDARLKEVASRKEWVEAEGRDMIAEFQSRGGVVGVTRVRDAGSSGNAIMHRGPYIITGTADGRYLGAVFSIAKLKKDGTPSSAATGYSPKKVIILPEDNA